MQSSLLCWNKGLHLSRACSSPKGSTLCFVGYVDHHYILIVSGYDSSRPTGGAVTQTHLWKGWVGRDWRGGHMGVTWFLWWVKAKSSTKSVTYRASMKDLDSCGKETDGFCYRNTVQIITYFTLLGRNLYFRAIQTNNTFTLHKWVISERSWWQRESTYSRGITSIHLGLCIYVVQHRLDI